MIDLVYLASNRLEFTKASLPALLANTNWADVGRLIIYDDDSTDGTREYLQRKAISVRWEAEFRPGTYGSPVAVMNHYLQSIPPERDVTFAKVDNDVMLPPNWLGDCLKIMREHPHVDLLGIEPMHTVAANCADRTAVDADHIGGIGLMRNRCFMTLPRPNGRFGFTAWQHKSGWVRAAWINPALPVFLLDRLPHPEWAALSEEYVAKGWQRPWGKYEEHQSAMWDWWQPEAVAA